MRKWIVMGIAALVAIAGASYYALAVYPTQRLRAGLNDTLAKLPPGLSGSYAGARYSVLTGRATLTGLELHHADPNGYDVTVEEIEAARPSLDAAASWARAAADPNAVAPDAAIVLADEITAKNVTYRDAMMNAAARTVHVVRPRLYPWALLRPGVPSMTDARAAFHPTPGHPPSLADLMPLLQVEASLMLGIGYDHQDGQALAATAKMPATPTTPAMTVAYAIEKFDGGAYDRGNGTLAAIDGVTARNDRFSMTIQHIALDGLALRDPLMQLLTGAEPSAAMLDGLALKRLAYGPMMFQAVGQPEPVEIGTFLLADVAVSHGLLVSGQLGLDGFRISRSQMPIPPVEAFLDRLELNTMTLSLGLSYRWYSDQHRILIHDATLKVDELGTLALSLDLDTINAPQDLLTRGRLVKAALRYDDASLGDRVIKLAGGADAAAAMRQQLIVMVQQTVAAPGAGDGAQAAAQAVSDFLNSPKALQVEIAPPKPVPLMALLMAWPAQIGQILPRLGLSIAANH